MSRITDVSHTAQCLFLVPHSVCYFNRLVFYGDQVTLDWTKTRQARSGEIGSGQSGVRTRIRRVTRLRLSVYQSLCLSLSIGGGWSGITSTLGTYETRVPGEIGIRPQLTGGGRRSERRPDELGIPPSSSHLSPSTPISKPSYIRITHLQPPLDYL